MENSNSQSMFIDPTLDKEKKCQQRREWGEKLGYPKCCIDAFIDSYGNNYGRRVIKEDEEENTHAQQVMHRVIGMERYTIFGNAVFVLVLLDINTVRVVGANFVQRKNVQHHQTKQNDW